MLKKTLPTLLGAALLFGAVVLVGFLAGCGSKAKTDEVTKKATDPTCGMEVAMTEGAVTHEYEGKTYYFCSADCKKAFIADPDKYLAEEAKVIDPVCGMEATMTPDAAKYEYEGKTYYFCSADCKTKFVADPGEYMEEMHEEMEEEMHGDDEHHGM